MPYPERPPVSIVLPFAGDAAEAEAMLDAMQVIRRRPHDELIVAENTRAPTVPKREGITIVTARRESSAYYARNEGTSAARNDWVLFIDADCRPTADLLDRYFDEPPADDVGAIVGEVQGVPGQSALVSRYARSRGHLGQEVHWNSPFRPWGVTANLLVRREAWASIGGFHEGVRSGGDTEFSWRLQDAGWRLRYQPQALVEHVHRDSVRRLARQAARYGAGRAWVMRRYPGSFERPALFGRLARCAAGIAIWTFTGQLERATFKALDAVYVISECAAYRLWSNTPPSRREIPAAELGLVADTFPDSAMTPSAPSIARDLGRARLEVAFRPIRVDRELARELPIAYGEDDGGFVRLKSLLWLLHFAPGRLLRHPRESVESAPAARRLQRAGINRIGSLGGPDAPLRASFIAELLDVSKQ